MLVRYFFGLSLSLLLFLVVITHTKQVLPLKQEISDTPKQLSYKDWKENGMHKTFIVKLVPVHTKDIRKIADHVTKMFNQFQKRLLELNIDSLPLFTYLNVFQGFSIYMDSPKQQVDIEQLELEFVMAFYPENSICTLAQHDFNHIRDETLSRMLNVHPFQSAGVKVAILDQGIRFQHAPFVVPGKKCDTFGDKGCRVKIIEDFLEIDFEEYQRWPPDTRRPGMGSGRIYGDHGTLMAGLIGGSDPMAPGLAQEVQFHDYKVQEEEGSGKLTHILAAIDLAARDKADVICISLNVVTPLGSVDISSDKIFKNGENEILITTSAGNMGEAKTFFTPSDFTSMYSTFTVASFDPSSTQTYSLYFKMKSYFGELLLQKFELKSLRTDEFDSLIKQEQLETLLFEVENPEADLNLEDRTGISQKIVIIHCLAATSCIKHYELLHGVQPIAIIFASSNFVLEYIESNFPMGQIQNDIAKFIRNAKNPNEKTVHIEKIVISQNYRTMIPAMYSSIGPALDLRIKPDFSFVGALPAYVGSVESQYTYSTGTSISNALFAAILALYVRKCQDENLKIIFADIKRRAQNTATPFHYYLLRDDMRPLGSQKLVYPVFHTGAGFIDVHGILNTKVSIEPPTLELGYIKPNQGVPFIQKNIRIVNFGSKNITYSIHHLRAPGVRIDPQHNLYVYSKFYVHVEIWSNTQTNPLSEITIAAHSEVFLDIVWSDFENNTPSAFINGYIRFIPKPIQIQEMNPEVPFFPYSSKEYTKLTVPYFFYYGDYQFYPTIVLKGYYAPFLTDLQILPYINNYYQNQAHFPIYSDESKSFPRFTLKQNSKPVISLCLRIRLLKLGFHLFHYHLPDSELGIIAHYLYQWDSCQLYLITGNQFAETQIIQEALQNDPESIGWSGKYFSLESNKMEEVEFGTYFICARTQKHGDDVLGVEEHTAWCSTPFIIGPEQRN